MKYTIFAHGQVITVDPERRVIDNGAVVVENDLIVDIGGTDQIIEKYKGSETEIIDCNDKMILPGFVDVHAHAGHTMFTALGYATQSNWMDIMTELYHHNTTDEFWYTEGKLAALSRLKNGVTCGLSVLTNKQRSDDPIIGINHSNAYAEVGLREIIAVGPSNPPYPMNITRVDKDGSKRETYLSFEELMVGAEDTIAKVNHSHDGLIRGFIAPFVLVTSVNASAPTVADLAIKLTDHDRYMMKSVREVAKNKKTRIHTEAFGGMIRLAAQDKNALLGPDVHIQHCLGISLDEAKILADTGTHVSSTPNVAQFLNRCPVPELMEMGVNVAIATDGTSPANPFDIIQIARQTQLVHRGALRDKNYFPIGKLLEMITIDAAKAIGWDDEIGSLEIGKKADIITIDLNRPHLTPKLMSLHKLFLFGTGNDVDNVMVNGKMVMRDYEAVNVNAQKVMDAADKEARTTISRAGFEKHLMPCDSFWKSTRMYVNEDRFSES